MMLRFWRHLFNLMKTGDPYSSCNHHWTYDNHTIRQCDKCLTKQFLVENRHPSPGEKRYYWR